MDGFYCIILYFQFYLLICLSQFLPDVFSVTLYPAPKSSADRQTRWSQHLAMKLNLSIPLSPPPLFLFLNIPYSSNRPCCRSPINNLILAITVSGSWAERAAGGGFHMRGLPPQQAVFKERNRWLLVEGT